MSNTVIHIQESLSGLLQGLLLRESLVLPVFFLSLRLSLFSPSSIHSLRFTFSPPPLLSLASTETLRQSLLIIYYNHTNYVQFRLFLTGKSELMSHVWSGTGKLQAFRFLYFSDIFKHFLIKKILFESSKRLLSFRTALICLKKKEKEGGKKKSF